MFSSNGADVKRIKLEYPARWPLDPDARKRISVWRRGRNITASAGLEFYGKGLYVNNPQMTATGQNAVLELRFKKMAVSEIPGFYNLYISVSHGNATDDFRPIRQQPTLKVLPGADAKPSKPRKGARAQVMEALTEDAVAQAQNRDAARTVEGTRSVMDEVKEDVAADLEAGKLDSAMKFVEGLEALVKSGKSAPKLGAKARDVRRALRAVESGSPIEAQAQTLLERLEAATR
ncbi:MAG: hypothetical protein HY814_15450 [Candidatus Riflebacteria bacterium]|nr:hypothetical protein [Candidatus Riflebacteria bacterium]